MIVYRDYGTRKYVIDTRADMDVINRRYPVLQWRDGGWRIYRSNNVTERGWSTCWNRAVLMEDMSRG